MGRDAEETRQQETVAKFRPWFPGWRDIPVSTEPMPAMTPREALDILSYETQCLYDGGTTIPSSGHAWDVIVKLVEMFEKNQVVKP